MTEWLQSTLVALIPSLVIAVVTAFITVRLSLKRFHAERWWELKAEAYSRIVDSLYHVKTYRDKNIKEYLEGVRYAPEHEKRLREEYSAAFRELSKATTIGAYIICDAAAKVFDDLMKRPVLDWDKNPPWEIFEDDLKAYGDALEEIRKSAKKDLGVR